MSTEQTLISFSKFKVANCSFWKIIVIAENPDIQVFRTEAMYPLQWPHTLHFKAINNQLNCVLLYASVVFHFVHQLVCKDIQDVNAVTHKDLWGYLHTSLLSVHPYVHMDRTALCCRKCTCVEIVLQGDKSRCCKTCYASMAPTAVHVYRCKSV